MTVSKSGLPLSRRALLSGAARLSGGAATVAAFGPLLSGCGGGEPVIDGPNGPYAVWRELQAALRASPDHTVGRAERLVEAGDIEALNAFVRDSIRLVTTQRLTFGLGPDTIWGARAALRAGAGTARDRADILADLVRRVGHEAEVVLIPKPLYEDSEALFFRNYEAPFIPEAGPRQLRSWRERLGAPPENANVAPIDNDHQDLIDQLLAGAGQSARNSIGPRGYRPNMIGDIPVVRITRTDGSVLLADPIRADGSVTSWPETLRHEPVSGEPEPLAVDVDILATSTADPGTPFVLTEGRFNAGTLAGRQLRVGFKPASELRTSLQARVADLRCFTPFLKVQALDGEDLSNEEGQRVGASLTLDGEKVEIDEDGTLRSDGVALDDGAPSGLANQVRSLEVEAAAPFFPKVHLTVRPLDGSGRLVPGLTSADFVTSDMGEAVPNLLRGPGAAPRILFLADNSLSMPHYFRNEMPAMRRLMDAARRAATSRYSGSTVDVRVVGSDLWSHLAEAASEPWSLIVYATDGDVYDDLTPDKQQIIEAGPPAIFLNVVGNMEYLRSYAQATDTISFFDRAAQLTGGLAIDADATANIETVERTLTQFIAAGDADQPYRLQLRAASDTLGERVALVRVGDQEQSAIYRYDGEASIGKRLASIRLRIKIGPRTVERVLAGHDGVGPVTQDDVNAAHGALWGEHLIAFEGGAPSLSTLIDDFLAAKLSMEPLDRATANEPADLDAIFEEIDAGFATLPGELLSLLGRTGPQSGEDFCLAEQGLRTVIFSVSPVMGSDQVRRSVDVLPLARAGVIARTNEQSVRWALSHSIPLARIEASLFQTSTISLLNTANLAPVDTYQMRRDGREPTYVQAWTRFEGDRRREFPYYGATILTSPDAGVVASWTLDHETGEAFAMLSDGRGGGEEAISIEAQLAELDRVISALNLLAAGAGAAGFVSSMGGFSLGVVAAYGQRLARLYAAVAMSITLMDASGIAPAVRLAIAGMACEIAKGLAIAYLTAGSELAAQAAEDFAIAENVAGLVGASSPFSCPI